MIDWKNYGKMTLEIKEMIFFSKHWNLSFGLFFLFDRESKKKLKILHKFIENQKLCLLKFLR